MFHRLETNIHPILTTMFQSVWTTFEVPVKEECMIVRESWKEWNFWTCLNTCEFARELIQREWEFDDPHQLLGFHYFHDFVQYVCSRLAQSRLRVVSPFSSRRSSRIERWEMRGRAKSGTRGPLSFFVFLPSPHFSRALSSLDSRRSPGGKEETTRSLGTVGKISEC